MKICPTCSIVFLFQGFFFDFLNEVVSIIDCNLICGSKQRIKYKCEQVVSNLKSEILECGSHQNDENTKSTTKLRKCEMLI